MIGLLRKADTLRIFDDLLADEEFWREFSQELERALAPRLLVIFFAGAEAAARLPKRRAEKAQPAEASDYISPEALARIGEQAIQGYVSPFAKQITQTTYDGVRDAVVRARRDGTGVEGVIESIKPMFSSKRAELIAVTETTRLFGLGSQAIYQAQGYTHWEWRTAEDPWVDDECAGLNGQVFPISRSFEPAHPRCRCWPTPAFELEQAGFPQAAYEKAKPVPIGSVTRVTAKDSKLIGLQDVSVDEQVALGAYQQAAFTRINGDLRTGTLNSDSLYGGYVQQIDGAMARSSISQSVVVYRGMPTSLVDKLSVGDSFTDAAYVSTSFHSERAAHFAMGDRVLATIRVPGGHNAIYMKKVTGINGGVNNTNEYELLLPRNTEFKVVSVARGPEGSIKEIVLDAQ